MKPKSNTQQRTMWPAINGSVSVCVCRCSPPCLWANRRASITADIHSDVPVHPPIKLGVWVEWRTGGVGRIHAFLLLSFSHLGGKRKPSLWLLVCAHLSWAEGIFLHEATSIDWPVPVGQTGTLFLASSAEIGEVHPHLRVLAFISFSFLCICICMQEWR